MSKAEKRHFKLFTSSGESNYIKLFDAIDKQKVYDEGKIRKKFAKETFGKKLAATKYLLYELILKGLRNFHSGKTVDSRLGNLLEEVELLFNKGLYKQSKKSLDKAKKLAKEAERHFFLHKILKWDRKILTYLAPDKLAEELLTILEEANHVSHCLNSEITYQELLDKTVFLYRTCMNPNVNCDLQGLDEVLSNTIMQGENQAPTFKAKLCYYEILSINSRINQNFKASFDALNKIKELFDQYPERINGHLPTFKRIMVDLVNCGLQAGIDFHYQGAIEEVKELPTDGVREEMKHDLLVAGMEFNYALNTGQMEQCSALLHLIEPILEQNGNVLDQVGTLKLYYHIGIYYFLTKEYSKCYDWLGKVQDFDKSGLYPSMLAFCRLLQLPVQYELKNYAYLEYQIRTTERYLKKKKQHGTLESLVLRHIKKCLASVNAKEANSILENLQASLEKMPQSETNILPLGERAINYWLSSKLKPNQTTTQEPFQLTQKLAFAV